MYSLGLLVTCLPPSARTKPLTELRQHGEAANTQMSSRIERRVPDRFAETPVAIFQHKKQQRGYMRTY